MKFHEKIRFKARLFGYGHKGIKTASREIVKKIDELDQFLDENINMPGKKKKKKKSKEGKDKEKES
ncbi:MAG: hypothetical protein PWP07_1212 [Epulopiscium sp.]|jgi:hypothetical protein|uniref:Uncharacterized protein n=1 Tax=Defluviitalea raffinosedens TaxID=1450156 RepID=A0A7C8LAX8_9FIRM|nr:hypothetical protein [Defluviitalea raffinosedens]MBZ4667697.1 hypothetical protein [Defluviitaleaceae bacterium]MDK2787987.1 hypothetical protein [Candidatus Epulonipiscium sp.]KAE9628747.1 hypothetical protein GND95_13665 [Defluviitalea raffinosedens]MBM7686849.1 hypothetical protein [Defluviitalea raffinosedens]HHW66121.1 hypothetical protein [Candidatus Epulonipiscium sp.]